MDSDMAEVHPENTGESHQVNVEPHIHLSGQETPARYPPPLPNQDFRQWKTGLCTCYKDWSSCCITIFCPCITFGQNAEIIDGGRTSCISAGRYCFCLAYLSCLCCFYTCTYRTKLRGLYSIPGNQCKDCSVHLFCTLCAICQEYRELQRRGYDPPLGWHGNEERRRQRASTVPPTVATGMTR